MSLPPLRISHVSLFQRIEREINPTVFVYDIYHEHYTRQCNIRIYLRYLVNSNLHGAIHKSRIKHLYVSQA